MRFLVAAVIMLLITVVSASEKVEITRPESSKIQKIIIDDDILSLKTKDKIYTFKLSDLVKQPNNPQTSKSTKDWCFFVEKKGNSNNFQYVGMNRRKVFHTGDLVVRFKKNNKFYVRDLDNNIFAPTWEVSKDFSSHLVPAPKFIDHLNNKINSTQQQIHSITRDLSNNEKKMKQERERYISYLQTNNIDETTITDSKGRIISIKNSGKYDSKIRKQLREFYNSLRDLERENNKLKDHLNSLSSQLNSLSKFKKKIDMRYTANVLSQ